MAPGGDPRPHPLPASVRLRFIPDPTRPGQSENGAAHDDDTPEVVRWRAATAVLAGRTATPARCVFAGRDGWGASPADRDVRRWTPFVERSYHLFEGDLNDLGDADAWRATLWRASLFGSSPPPDPAFLSPADRAWCITRDVDLHVAVISASTPAIGDLLRLPGLDLVRTALDEDPPRFG